MLPAELIRLKRDGGEIPGREIAAFISGYASGKIPDYQMSALLMAILFRGMSPRELAAWTEAMIGSGRSIDLSDLPGIKVDKHSTGGVGDKCTLICAPAAAACGVPVPMMCGRGLGHTGGTVDKLESIAGFRVSLSAAEFKRNLRRHGIAVTAQTEDLAPADRRMYALRDVTGTVESIPLIASSIMSKKIAGGADALVLDVKCGHGAFMKNRRAAAALASAMISAGRRAGMRVAALITDMSQPLGTHVGNALEVSESIEILKGRTANDCSALSLELAAMMVLLGGRARDASSAGAMVRRAVESGRALEKFREMIIAQGGDHRVVDDHERLPRAPARIAVRARRAGFIKTVLAADIGTASVSLGAGRSRLDSELDHGAGIVLHKKAGDRVEKGDRLCTLHHDPDRTGRGAQEIEARALGAFVISSRKKSGPPVIIGRKGPR